MLSILNTLSIVKIFKISKSFRFLMSDTKILHIQMKHFVINQVHFLMLELAAPFQSDDKQPISTVYK